jgi:hypothetical protein
MSNNIIFNEFQYNNDGNIIYYYCQKRCTWIHCRNYDKTLDRERFFIDDTQLTFEQISNYEIYKQVRDQYIQYEEWRIDTDCVDYSYSSLGRFKLKNGMISDVNPAQDGYVKVQLSYVKNKIRIITKISLHRKIAGLFIFNDNPQTKTEVDHINGIKHDNRVINLRWVTPSENNTNKTFVNSTNSTKRPVTQYNPDGSFVKEWGSASEIKSFCNGVDTIYRHLDGKKLLYGFYWYRTPDTLLEGEIFKELYLSEINRTIKISNKSRFVTLRNTISDGSLNTKGYKVTNLNDVDYCIHRLTMMAFYPISNPENFVVDHIDENKSNNILENLRWMSSAQNTQVHHAINNNRTTTNQSSKSRPIIFTQLSNGKEFEFKSIAEGIKKSGFSSGQVKGYLSGGYANPLRNVNGDFTVRYSDGIIRPKQSNDKAKVRVIQLDLFDGFLKIYNSITEASLAVNGNHQNIGRCCQGEGVTAHKFKWKYEDEAQLAIGNTREVFQLDMNGKSPFYYPSIMDAERNTGIDNSSITSVCRKHSQSAGNFKWMYYEEYLALHKTFYELNSGSL